MTPESEMDRLLALEELSEIHHRRTVREENQEFNDCDSPPPWEEKPCR
jgi:hypothetical protein